MSNDVLVDYFTQASSAVVEIAEHADLVAGQFRRHELKVANDGLTPLTKEIAQFCVMVEVLRGPLAIEPARLTVDGVTVDDQLAHLSGWLESLIEAHGNADWLTIADILGLDVEPLLRAWGSKLLEYGPESTNAD